MWRCECVRDASTHRDRLLHTAGQRTDARIVRSAADGDLVYLHVHATEHPGDRGEAVVDIFRVKDGKIVEHWDVIQPVPETSANRNTMF